MLAPVAGDSLFGDVQVTGHCSDLNTCRLLLPIPPGSRSSTIGKIFLLAARLLLKRHFASVETLRDPSSLTHRVRAGTCDVVLLDMNFAVGADRGADRGLQIGIGKPDT